LKRDERLTSVLAVIRPVASSGAVEATV
jgi:hypothetical protein